MTNIQIRHIKKLFLFGGSQILFDTVRSYKDAFEVIVVTSPRHAYEVIDGNRLVDVAHVEGAACIITDDVNADDALKQQIDAQSLGLAFGAAEVFSKELVTCFEEGYFLDLMVIDLPRYRGAAHSTWQILNQNFKGVINIQQIVGGEEAFHKGPILATQRFDISQTCTMPEDYFALYGEQSRILLADFFANIKAGNAFNLTTIDEDKASFFPALSTIHHGWINWSWSAEDICLFINAFGSPYLGASTLYGEQPVFLNKVCIVPHDDYLHPFCAGLVIRKTDGRLFVGAKGGLIQIDRICDEEGQSVFDGIAVGTRLFTPVQKLEEVMCLNVRYDTEGLKL